MVSRSIQMPCTAGRSRVENVKVRVSCFTGRTECMRASGLTTSDMARAMKDTLTVTNTKATSKTVKHMARVSTSGRTEKYMMASGGTA